ncbi:MAG: hypothetical protein ACI8S6_001053 [Myxococcota bacterium]|jgi:hypothetical protein
MSPQDVSSIDCPPAGAGCVIHTACLQEASMTNNPQALRSLLVPPDDPADVCTEAVLANLRWLATMSPPQCAVWWHRRAERLARSRLMRWSELQTRSRVSEG